MFVSGDSWQNHQKAKDEGETDRQTQGQNLKFTVTSLFSSLLHVHMHVLSLPCVLYVCVEGCKCAHRAQNEASEADSPSTFRSMKERDFLRIRYISSHCRDHGLAEDCTTVLSCYQDDGDPRPGQQNCVRMLLPTQPSSSPSILCWCAHQCTPFCNQHCYCPEKAQAWVSDIAQHVKDLLVVPEDPGPTW